jgi:tRNA(fMet)-specific endonuclease VapC
MILDTNVVIQHIRKQIPISSRAVLPIVVVGELEAFALKSDWGYQKMVSLNSILEKIPIADIDREITQIYAKVDAYSQGKLKSQQLPLGMSARNMGKNDLWIAAISLYFDFELHSIDNDFDHLVNFGLKLVKPVI